MPIGMNLSGLSKHQINAIARQSNERQRKAPGCHTPAEIFGKCAASTG